MTSDRISAELYRTETHNNVFLLAALPDAEMDVYGARNFRDALSDAITDPTVDHIILDFQELRFMDAVGAGICVGALDRALHNNKTFSIDISRNEKIAKVFRLTGLTPKFHLIDNAREAQAS